jgi:hypothetical protein
MKTPTPTREQVDAYRRDGFVLVGGLFDFAGLSVGDVLDDERVNPLVWRSS